MDCRHNANERSKHIQMDASYWADSVWDVQRLDVCHMDKVAKGGSARLKMELNSSWVFAVDFFRSFSLPLAGLSAAYEEVIV